MIAAMMSVHSPAFSTVPGRKISPSTGLRFLCERTLRAFACQDIKRPITVCASPKPECNRHRIDIETAPPRPFVTVLVAVSVLDEPAMCAQVDRLARAIAGNGADNFRLDQARIIAEAQLDLVRIQDAKVTLMNSYIAETRPLAPGHDATRNSQWGDANLAAQSDDPSSKTKLPKEIAMAPTIEVLRQLAGLERYEHRAICRRRRAMRAFLAYQ